jgi:hypothetical protein
MLAAALVEAVAEPAAALVEAVAEPAAALVAAAAEPVEVRAAAPVEALAVVLVEALVAERAEADRRVRSEADWIRATHSHHRRNPLPASAARVQTVRQEVLPGGCSPHINACPLQRFRIPTGRSASCCERTATVSVGIIRAHR